MFDRDYSARLVLGVHGRGASDADVKLFADALADSLMQRYGSSLLDLNTKLKVRVKSETPLRGGAIVKVSSEYLRQGNEAVPVDYLMRKVGTQWKVFDVMVEGVSFVQTFRNQFDTPLKQKSIPQVAADIKAGRLQAQASQQLTMATATVRQDGDTLVFGGALERAAVASLWPQLRALAPALRRIDLSAVSIGRQRRPGAAGRAVRTRAASPRSIGTPAGPGRAARAPTASTTRLAFAS